ncbi:MAG: hypothetical protein K6A42_12190 [Treponema sp.]|nr:hypothetical protein [Treponema sp.]
MKMVKKGLALALAAAIALTLAGCSNSSDSGAFGLAGGTGTGTTSGTGNGTGGGTNTGTENGGSGTNNGTGSDGESALPANVGSNDFVGKTFSITDGNGATAKYAFGSDTVTFTSTFSSAETVTVSSYSFNATTKQLFLKKVSSSSYFINDGTRTAMPEMDSFTSDAEFIAAYKKSLKQLYPSYTDEQLTNTAKGTRFPTFAPYGYTDSTNATEVSNEIIAKYNAAQAESKTRNTLVDIYAYDLTGSTLKLLSDSRIPAGKGLNEIYGVYSTQYMITSPSLQLANILAIKDGSDNIVYNLNYSSKPAETPDITNAASNAGYRVSSISESAINTSATATATATATGTVIATATGGGFLAWTFTPATGSFSYTTNKTATSGVFDITGLGKITVTYATAGNIPTDWTAAATYIVDNTQGGGTDLQAESAYFKAEAVSGGVKLTVKKSATSYDVDGIQIFVWKNDDYEKNYSEIGRIFPDWPDKSQDWTGVYPLVDKGKTYQFNVQSSDRSLDETVKCKAGGGSGEINYANNPSMSLALSASSAAVRAVNYPPSLIPASATDKNAHIEYYAGTGWHSDTQTWDGDWILNREEASIKEPENGLCDYSISSSDPDYETIKTAMKTSKNSAKKIFVLFTYDFKLAGISGVCRTRYLQSQPMDASVLRLTQNGGTDLQAESANFKAEAVSGGIKLTIKAPADSTKYDNCNIHIIMQQNDGMEFGRIYPEWTDKTQVWTCVYPLVDNGKTYQIIFQPNGGLPNETVKCKAGGGSGEIKYANNPSVGFRLWTTNTVVAVFNCPPSLITSYSPSSVTEQKAYMVYYAGTGWNDATQTWDAQFILDRRESLREPEDGRCEYLIRSFDTDYTKIKNAMKDTYPTKKIFAQFYYEFKVAGIAGVCCTRHMNSEPMDASILRQ